MKGRLAEIKIIAWFLLVVALLGGAGWWAWHKYVTTPPYVDPDRFPVRGIDISAHNGYANLDAVAAEGYDFVWIKASEGKGFRDPNFALNYDKARKAGLKTGAYHFFRFDRDGIQQARNLLNVIGKRDLELGIAIDVEEYGNPAGIPLDSIKNRLQVMVEYLNMKGHRVTFYSNRKGWEDILRDEYEGFPLWVCSFTDNSTADDWTFWQFNHHGKVSGVRGDVDINVFRGSREEWEEYLNESQS